MGIIYEIESPARVRDTAALNAVAETSIMSARKRLNRPVVAIAWRGKSERGLNCVIINHLVSPRRQFKLDQRHTLERYLEKGSPPSRAKAQVCRDAEAMMPIVAPIPIVIRRPDIAVAPAFDLVALSKTYKKS